MTPSDAVLYTQNEHIGLLTLNRPDERNSMTPETLSAFDRTMDVVLASRVRCVVMTGAGACFSAGANLRGSLQREAEDNTTPTERSYAMYAPFLRILDVEVPVIAALNGHAVGGGFGLALLADIRIANRTAKFGANFARLGIHSGLAITYLLPRLVGLAHASEMLLTGDLIDGAHAERIGLVNHAVAAAEVLPRAMVVARRVAAAAPGAVRGIKHSMREGLEWHVREAAARDAVAQAASLESADAREGIAALLEKREPKFADD